jgi:hypothetical protein
MRALLLAFGASGLVALALAINGCNVGRFPTCNDNQDCVKSTDGGAPVCFDLRCVECQYDVDCPTGKVCNIAARTCDPLGGNTAANQGETQVDAGAADPSSKWSPGSWDDCARDCKDQDCIHNCDSKFPKGSSSAAAKKPPPKK